MASVVLLDEFINRGDRLRDVVGENIEVEDVPVVDFSEDLLLRFEEEASASSSSENGEVYPLFVWMQLRYDLYAAATSSLAMSSSAVAT
eukprot:CAMPEP_0170509368 /NCGR_PEP_ID=MMETSP0208-20121228/65179_1 /TAXON_ID=197538 /ORGANISM="Strombidium inclinatum, Strain S3" /LENGTH=88 /DNA_ID=CAMNT_0010792725 /DNA_START=1155 /DNA_END=1422 /DNA_ORIENTATION=+